jgi:hypothetical protein
MDLATLSITEHIVMLTIDCIVEKYRSLRSDATFSANLAKVGMSAAAIKEAVANRRWPTNAEQEQRAERYRAKLIALPRAEQITRYLSLFGSHERSLPLWEATIGEPPDVFWPVFLENWCICDGLWPLRQILLSTLRHRAAELSPIGFMKGPDRKFYEEMAPRITVFRGCGRRRVRGLPWTTDREIAAKFARGGRFRPPPDPVIAGAEIDKTGVFFVSTARNESEVILDPYSIQRLRLEAVPSRAA